MCVTRLGEWVCVTRMTAQMRVGRRATSARGGRQEGRALMRQQKKGLKKIAGGARVWLFFMRTGREKKEEEDGEGRALPLPPIALCAPFCVV